MVSPRVVSWVPMRMGRTYPTWSGAENDNFCGSIGALMAWTIGPKVDRLTRTSRNVWQPQNAPRSIEQMEVKGSSAGSCKHWADDIVYIYMIMYLYIYNIHIHIYTYILYMIMYLYIYIHMYIHIYIYVIICDSVCDTYIYIYTCEWNEQQEPALPKLLSEFERR